MSTPHIVNLSILVSNENYQEEIPDTESKDVYESVQTLKKIGETTSRERKQMTEIKKSTK